MTLKTGSHKPYNETTTNSKQAAAAQTAAETHFYT